MRENSRGGRLTVYNGAGQWTKHVSKGIADFNGLPFKIILDPEPDKIKADIVVMISYGKLSAFTWDRREIKSDFDAAATHGQTGSFLDSRDRVEKAVIFLPAKLKKIPDEIKVLVVVHELIHACGLVEKNDHDPIGGIMYATMQLVDGKLREPSMDKNLKGMPPIRIGTWTQCKISELWHNSEDCKE